ncbi:MAG: ribose-phosphate pyrophosphokinase [Armatimonadetes bacterium]|nr:ribose-phosphate pyrophosphokinase [Armatimonadota bacterium]
MLLLEEEQPSLQGENIVVFSGNSNPRLAQAIAEYLGIPLGRALVGRFTNGEIRVQVEENVRGAEVFVIQPTCGNVNETLMELLIIIDALSRSSARTITAVVPYYGYARQEKKTAGREPITAKLVANLITTAGADRVVTVDLHAGAIQGFFDIPVDNLMAMPIVVEYFQRKPIDARDLVVVSPDAGGVARARAFAERLHASLAIIFKRRPQPDAVEAVEVVGEIDGKTVLIVDDIISTGGTLVRGVETLIQLGAQKVYACATHAILAGDALSLIEDSSLEEVIVTDTIPVASSAQKGKLTVLSVAPLLGETIRRNYFNLSVSKLFG